VRTQSRLSIALSGLISTAALLSACGGNRPADQAAAPASASPAPAAAPAAGDQVAQAVPPPSAPPAAEPAVKPAAKPAKPAPRAEPTPPPKPEPVIKTLAAGTDLEIELLDGASSKTSKVGDLVRGRVTKAVMVDGLTAVPAGATVEGTVTEAIALRKIGGTASLGLRFDTLEPCPTSCIPIKFP
jgi:predicted component of type VI protein secretion system